METKPKFFCFTLMPFSDDFDDIYSLGIQAACNSAGAYCERVDEQVFQESILDRIYNQISKADLVIADMSKKNPNVFYEVGYAHALGKPTVLLTQDPNDIPFDMKHFQHIVYNNRISYLKDELIKRISWYKENPEVSTHNAEVKFEIFLGQKSLLKNKVILCLQKNVVPLKDFVIYNSSPFTFEPGSFRIAIISSPRYHKFRSGNTESFELPDGNYMHIIPFLDIIHPESYSKFQIFFDIPPELNKEDKFIIRIFTQFGKFDYPFYIKIDPNSETSHVEIEDGIY